MAYILNKTNGTVLAKLEDGEINQSTDLVFVGRNYAGYGEIVNEDLLRLLENFANKTAPTKPITGQIWYDTTNKRLRIYDGANFKSLSQTEISSSQPRTLNIGEFWFNTSENRLYVKSGVNEYTLIGPTSVSPYNASNILTTVLDEYQNTQYVVRHVIRGNTIAVVSNDEFPMATTEDLYADFPYIRRGVNLKGADSVTGDSVSELSQYWFWGTAAHALRLGDYAADEYLLKAEYNADLADGLDVLNDAGVLVGYNGVFRFHADSNLNQGKISAVNGTNIAINLKHPTLNDPLLTALIIYGDKLVPGPSATISLGASGTNEQFSYVYANTFTGATVCSTNVCATSGNFTSLSGTLTGNVTGNVTGNITGTLTGNSCGTHTGPVNSTQISAGAPGTAACLTGAWTVNGLINSKLCSTCITSGGPSVPGTLTGCWTIDGSLNGIIAIACCTLNSLSSSGYLCGSSFNGGTARTWSVNAGTSGSDNLVARDGSGNFSAGTIAANLSGSASCLGGQPASYYINNGNIGSQTVNNSVCLNGQPGSYYQDAASAITTGNIGSQSVNYANSAGTANNSTCLGGQAASYYINTGNIGSQSVNYASNSGALGGYSASTFARASQEWYAYFTVPSWGSNAILFWPDHVYSIIDGAAYYFTVEWAYNYSYFWGRTQMLSGLSGTYQTHSSEIPHWGNSLYTVGHLQALNGAHGAYGEWATLTFVNDFFGAPGYDPTSNTYSNKYLYIYCDTIGGLTGYIPNSGGTGLVRLWKVAGF